MDFAKACRNCKEDVHCCIFKGGSGFTFVSITDAKRIKEKTKRDYDHFLDFSPLPKKTLHALKDDDPSLEGALRIGQLEGKNKLLRLKTKKDGYCIFLNIKKKCDIYSIRPNICRIFPFWAVELEDGTLKVIPHDVYPRCNIVKNAAKTHADIEKYLSKKEINDVKRVFKDIKKEDVDYRKNIRRLDDG